MMVVGIHRMPLVRQTNEAFRINSSRAQCIMNSKTEWHQAPLVRVIPMSGLQGDQGTGRGSLLQGGAGQGRVRGRGGREGGKGPDEHSPAADLV